jgi:hypothetical protein
MKYSSIGNPHSTMVSAENSRETFRKEAMHHFRNAAFIEDKSAERSSRKARKDDKEDLQRSELVCSENVS